LLVRSWSNGVKGMLFIAVVKELTSVNLMLARQRPRQVASIVYPELGL
jgi:hypothetical protein